MKRFTKRQPKDGDVVLHCGHLDVKPLHFYFSPTPTVFQDPSGVMGSAMWFVQCNTCHLNRGTELEMRGHIVWKGDEPIIEEPIKS